MKAVLQLLGDGKAILSTDEAFTAEEASRIKDVWADWVKSVDGLLILSGIEVLEIRWPMDGQK